MADRYAPRQLPICWVPVEPPPSNQISSPGVTVAREEVAGGQVLDADTGRLEHDQAVSPRRERRWNRAGRGSGRPPRSCTEAPPAWCRRARPRCGPCRGSGCWAWSRARRPPPCRRRRPREERDCRSRGSRPARLAPSPRAGRRRPLPGCSSTARESLDSCRRAGRRRGPTGQHAPHTRPRRQARTRPPATSSAPPPPHRRPRNPATTIFQRRHPTPHLFGVRLRHSSHVQQQ